MKFLFSKRKFVTTLIAGCLTLSFVLAPVSQTLEVRRAEAVAGIGDIVFDPVVNATGIVTAGAATWSAISNSVSAAGLASLGLKEWTFDGVAFALINIVIKEMIRSTTRWVASGFKGSPTFVTDLEGFMLNIADKIAGNFIYNAGLGALCSPFKLNIQLALDFGYQKTRGYEAKCRLSQVVANMDRFLGGDFAEGGWDGWFELSVGSSNPYTTKFEAEAALYVSISNAQGQEIKLLDFGRGFFSKVDDDCEADSGRPCHLQTPGAVIESQINEVIKYPGQRLNVADEINELIGALLTQLGKEILSGAGGLLGLGDSSYGNANYWSRVDADTSVVGYVGNSEPVFESPLEQERRFISLNTTVVNMVTDIQTYREVMYPVLTYTDPDTGRIVSTTPCAPGELTPSLSRALVTAKRNIASTTVLVQELTLLMDDYNKIQNASTAPTTLQTLMQTYNGTSIPDTKSKILNRYLQYQSSGRLHDASLLVDLEIHTIRQLGDEIASFKASIDNACRNYNSELD